MKHFFYVTLLFLLLSVSSKAANYDIKKLQGTWVMTDSVGCWISETYWYTNDKELIQYTKTYDSPDTILIAFDTAFHIQFYENRGQVSYGDGYYTIKVYTKDNYIYKTGKEEYRQILLPNLLEMQIHEDNTITGFPVFYKAKLIDEHTIEVVSLGGKRRVTYTKTDDATGIKKMHINATSRKIYQINGTQVSEMDKGIYIVQEKDGRVHKVLNE